MNDLGTMRRLSGPSLAPADWLRRLIGSFAAGGLRPSLVADFAGASGREGYAKPLPILGPELATNGGFDVDTTGWTNNGLATLDVVSGRLHAVANSNGDSVSQDVAVTDGKAYAVSFDYEVITAEVYDGAGVQWSSSSITGTGQVSHRFVASGASARIEFAEGGSSNNAEFYIDNVSVREITGYRAVRTTFTDLITHSRSGNATMVDSDGLLKWAPHNLVKWSDDLSYGAWFRRPGMNAVSGKLNEGTGNQQHYVYQSGTNALGQHTIALTVESAGDDRYLQVRPYGEGSDKAYINVDPDAGTISDSGGTGIIDSGIVPDPAGGFLVWLTLEYTNLGGVHLQLIDDPNAAELAPYDGDGISGLYVRRVRLYRSDLGGMVDNPDTGDSYVPTTSAAKYLPRRNHCRYDLAAGTITGPDLISNGQFSQGFTGWGAYRNATLSVVSGALRVTSDAATTGASGSQAFVTVPGKAYRLRFKLVAESVGGRARVAIGHHGDLGNAAATDLHDAYYDGAAGFYEVRFIAEQATTWVILANGNAGASYVEFDNVSVFEVLPGVVQGILHESEARTNLITHSNDFTNAVWTKTQVNVSAPSVDSPLGSTGGSLLTSTTGTACYLRFSTTKTAGAEYTMSIFAKGGTATIAYLRDLSQASQPSVYFDLSSGLVGEEEAGIEGDIENVGDGWYRITATSTSGDPINNNLIDFGFADADGSRTCSDGKTGYFCGAQLEAAATPSSYIPTNGSTATRPADALTIPAANLPYHPDGLWMAMKGQMTYADNGVQAEQIPVEWEIDANNRIRLYLDTLTAGGTGAFRFQQAESSTFDTVSQPTDSLTPGVNVPFSIASRHGPTYINGAADGTALTADNTPTALANLSATDLDLGYDFMGIFKSFVVGAGNPADTGIAGVST